MPTTTPEAILNSITSRIVTRLTPNYEAERKFELYEEQDENGFRDWAERNKDACFRKFSALFLGEVSPPSVSNTDAERVEEEIEIVVAYPHTLRFRSIVALHHVVREDLRQIEHEVGSNGFNALDTDVASIGTATVVTVGQRREDGPPVTFGVLRLRAGYYRSNA